MPANLESSTVVTALEKVSFHSNPKKDKVKGFGIVNEAEIDIFLELSCFFDD